MKNTFQEYLYAQKYSCNSNIELTYRCTLLCKQCMRSNILSDDLTKKQWMQNKIKSSFDIPLDDLRKLLDFFEDDIRFCGQFSDPIYHPQFYDILDICSNEYPDKQIKIHTAAHQKNLEWYRQAFERTGRNIVWVFGLDGLSDTSFQYRTNQNSQLIFDAMLLGSEMGVRITWQYIVFKFNEHQMDQAKTIAKENGILLNFVLTNRKSNNVEPASETYRPKSRYKDYIKSC